MRPPPPPPPWSPPALAPDPPAATIDPVPRSVVTIGGNGNGDGTGHGGENVLTQMLTLMLTDKMGLSEIGKDSQEDDMGPEAKAYLKKIMASIGDEAVVDTTKKV